MKFKLQISQKKLLFWPLISALFLSSAYIYSTPYLSIISFKSSLDHKEYEKTNKYINFPSVRESLKLQLQTAVTEKFSNQLKPNPYASFGMLFIDPIINGVVDLTVTPTGLNILLTRGSLTTSQAQLKDSSSTSDRSNPKSKMNSETIIKLYYQDFNRFVLSSQMPNQAKPIKIFWERKTPFRWELSSLDIPTELLKLN